MKKSLCGAISAALLFLSLPSANAGVADWITDQIRKFTGETGQEQNLAEIPFTLAPIDTDKLLPGSITLKVRNLLENGDHQTLNDVLDNYLSTALTNYDQEDDLLIAYEVFETPGIDRQLKQWIEKHPDSYQPLLATGIHYYRKAWDARGHKWASETEEHQFEAMRKHFRESRANLKESINLKPDNYLAHIYLLLMWSTLGDDDETLNHYRKAIRIHPESYLSRYKFITTLTPRWGSSYDKMAKYAKQARPYRNSNPRLNELPGWMYYDFARTNMNKNDYAAATEASNKALELSESDRFYLQRAKIHFHQTDHEKALANLDRAIELNPDCRACYAMRAATAYKLENLELLKDDTRRTIALYGVIGVKRYELRQLSAALSNQAYAFHQRKNYKEAFEIANLAIRVDKDYHYNFGLRGRMLAELRQFPEAEKDMAKAIELDPKNMSHYKYMDWLLLQRRAFDEIIAYWDNYIELDPNNAEAYYQRSGTKYHKGVFESALADAEKAMALGHPDAKKATETIKARM